MTYRGLGRRFFLGALIVILLVVNAACSGDSGPSDPSTAATTSTAGSFEADFDSSVIEGKVPLEVTFTNLSTNGDVFEWDFGDGSTATSSAIDERLTHEYTEIGTFEVTLLATLTGQTDVVSATPVSVTVNAGPLADLTIETGPVKALPGEELTISAVSTDQFGNEISGLTYEFKALQEAGNIDQPGKFTAGTVAGEFASGVTVSVTQNAISQSATVDVTVEHGLLDQIVITPEAIALDIGDTQEFTALAVDSYDNPISDAKVVWAADELVGTISGDGSLVVGTKAGNYANGVTATASLNGVSEQTHVSLTVNPGPAEGLFVDPVKISAGESIQLQASIADKYGNPLETAEVTWRLINPSAGTIDSAGLFSASEIAGEFGETIEATAAEGGLSATGPVTINPGALHQVVIGPRPAAIGIQMTQQFLAVGADKFGNRIGGLSYDWSLKSGGGTIGQGGLFTAGTDPGIYSVSVKATERGGESGASATSTVSVEPDRIAFLSDRGGETLDLYVMNSDGTNVQRLTTGANVVLHTWSPDGRRIFYDSVTEDESFGIFSVSDDGEWNTTVIEGNDANPAWSPDGESIVFASGRDGNKNIYLMDIDGGNQTRLTDDSSADERPAWSPNGEQIAFVSTRLTGVESGLDRIWVMDLDGENQHALTIDPGRSIADTTPSWSPSGLEIAFQSAEDFEINWRVKVLDSDGLNQRILTTSRDGGGSPGWTSDGQEIVFHSFREDDQADIYTMNQNGGDVVRLTTNEARDVTPRWAPRKKGVEASQASIVIPTAAPGNLRTIQQVTADSRAAVVRIETDLGSGSGFVFSSDGKILTNNHVIVDVDEITVIFEDGSRFAGEIIGRDMLRDLAVLKIDAQGLEWLEFGDISWVSLGVLGFPLGRSNLSVSRGLASAFPMDPGRNIHWVQTDSAINPGNSGGPLVDLQGKVVGIVSSKFVGAGLEGLGFAISANTAKLYLDRLLNGEIIRGPSLDAAANSSTVRATEAIPSIFLSPPDASMGSDASLIGTGFPPLSNVSVQYILSQLGPDSLNITLATLRTDRDGTFRADVIIPFNDRSGLTNQIFAVSGSWSDVIDHVLPSPYIEFSKGNAEDFRQVSLAGAGFPPEMNIKSLSFHSRSVHPSNGTKIQLSPYLFTTGDGQINFDFLLPEGFISPRLDTMTLTIGAISASSPF